MERVPSPLAVLVRFSPLFVLATSACSGGGGGSSGPPAANPGQGLFVSPSSIPAPIAPQAVVSGDFDDDGDLDLAVAGYDPGRVKVLLGDGLGGFEAHGNYPIGLGALALAAADLDGDGALDLAVCTSIPGELEILRGTGAGGFVAETFLEVGDNPGDST